MSQRPTPFTLSLCALIVLHYEGIAAKEHNDSQLKKQQSSNTASAANADSESNDGADTPPPRISPLYHDFDEQENQHVNNSRNNSFVHPRALVESFLQEQLISVQDGNLNAPVLDLIKALTEKVQGQDSRFLKVPSLFLNWLR